jgi:hypothetical protein
MRLLLHVATLVVILLGDVAIGDWNVIGAEGGGPGGCRLQTNQEPIHDGYLDIHAWLEISDRAVIVHTESPLDTSFSDIGLQVDENAFVPMDRLEKDKAARFESLYPTLVEQFKKGRSVRVQLRFWPTWPATGAHSTTFSLKGFTKAYTSFSGCAKSP